MKRIILAVLVLVMAGIGFATTYYVDSDSTAGGTGTTNAITGADRAFATIAAGMTAAAGAASGNIVKICPGTYAESIVIDSTCDNSSFLVESETTQVTVTASSNYGCVYTDVENAGYLVSFKNINFNAGAIADERRYVYISVSTNTDARLYFENCNFVDRQEGRNHRLLEAGAADTALREVTFKDCTYSTATLGAFGICGTTYGFKKLKIDGGTYTCTADSTTAWFSQGAKSPLYCIIQNATLNNAANFYAESSSSVTKEFTFANNTYTQTAMTGNRSVFSIDGATPNKPIIIKDSTFTCGLTSNTSEWTVVSIGTGATAVTHGIRGTQIVNNTMSTTQPYLYGTGIYLSRALVGGSIVGNTITGFDTGINSQGDAMLLADNHVETRNTLILTGASYCCVKNNLFRPHSTAEDSGHAVCISNSRRAWTAQSTGATTTFTATTAVDATAWNLDKVVAGQIATVYETTGGLIPAWYGIVVSGVTATKTVTVDRWVKVSDLSVGTPTDGWFCIVSEWAHNNIITHNILNSGSALDCMTFHYAPLHGYNYINYNIYNISTNVGNLAYGLPGIGTGSRKSLAEERAIWASWPNTLQDPAYVENNDSYSKSQNPGSSTGLYIDMDGNGTKEWVGIPQSSGFSKSTHLGSGGSILGN